MEPCNRLANSRGRRGIKPLLDIPLMENNNSNSNSGVPGQIVTPHYGLFSIASVTGHYRESKDS